MSIWRSIRMWWRKRHPSARKHRDDWIRYLIRAEYKPRTIDGYRRLTDAFLERWPDRRLDQITEHEIIGYIEEASPRSRQQRRSAFHNWFAWAHRTRRIEKNPMDHVPTYKQPVQEPVVCFTEPEIDKLLGGRRGTLHHPDSNLMAVLFGTGIRKSEARHLTVRKIDFENGELHITEGAKGSSIGVIPLSTTLVHRLRYYVGKEHLGPDDYLWYCPPGGAIARRHSKPISDAAMHMWWERSLETAGVEYRKLHATRHTFATFLRRAGMPLDDVSDWLRHADPRTTRKVYVHLQSIDLRERANALGVELLA